MKHELIKTNNYLLIVDNNISEQTGYWLYLGDSNDPLACNLPMGWFEKLWDKYKYKNVIAHLPLNNAHYLEGVDCLPPINDDIEKIFLDNLFSRNEMYHDGKLFAAHKKGFIEGYNAAGGYTEDDMIEFGRWIIQNPNFQHDSSWSKETAKYHLDEWKYPKYFLLTERMINPQGRTEWVGKYIKN